MHPFEFIKFLNSQVNWEKMRQYFAGDAKDLLEKIDSYRPDSATNSYPKYARIEEIRSLISVSVICISNNTHVW